MSRTDAGTVEAGSDMEEMPRRNLQKNFGGPGWETAPTVVPRNPFLLRHLRDITHSELPSEWNR